MDDLSNALAKVMKTVYLIISSECGEYISLQRHQAHHSRSFINKTVLVRTNNSSEERLYPIEN